MYKTLHVECSVKIGNTTLYAASSVLIRLGKGSELRARISVPVNYTALMKVQQSLTQLNRDELDLICS